MTEPQPVVEAEIITDKATHLVKLRKEADEAAEKTLESLSDLIIATLKTPSSDRFAEVTRLCNIAQQLIRARGRRAEDFKKIAEQGDAAQDNMDGPVVMAHNGANIGNAFNVVAFNNGGANVAQMVGPAREIVDGQLVDRALPVRREPGRILFDDQGRLVNEQGIAYTGPLDANSLMRHMLVTFGPNAQTGAEANRARVAAEETAELKLLVSLSSAATDPEKSILEKRISQLMTNMQMRTQNANGTPDPQEEPKPGFAREPHVEKELSGSRLISRAGDLRRAVGTKAERCR